MGTKDTTYDYLKASKYMSLATASLDGKPEVATVEYIVDGDNIIINTDTRYRKYQNVIANQQVACVVTTDHDQTLQFDGTIHQLTDVAAEAARLLLLAADPSFIDYFTVKYTRFFKITPTWLRLRDYTTQLMMTTEYRPKS